MSLKTVYHNKTTKETTIFSCRKDLSKLLDRKETTLWKWSKKGIKETNEYILFFNCEDQKSKTKKGNANNFNKDQY